MIDSYERRGTLVPQEDFKQVVIERKTRQVSKVHLCRACSVPDRFIKEPGESVKRLRKANVACLRLWIDSLLSTLYSVLITSVRESNSDVHC